MPAKPDLTLTHEAVKLVRDTLRFCPNQGYRKDMIVCGEADMKLWQSVVKLWATPYRNKKGKMTKRNPLAYGKMLAEFDRLYADKK